MYFYKNTSGGWIVGSTPYDIFAPDGQRELSPVVSSLVEGNYTNVSMSLGLGKNYNNVLITSIKKNVAGEFYATFAEFYAAVEPFFIENNDIANGEYTATLSDTVDLANPGWIQPILLAGTIKYVTVNGEVRTKAFDLNETSLVRVKQVWLTGTTADMGIVVYY